MRNLFDSASSPAFVFGYVTYGQVDSFMLGVVAESRGAANPGHEDQLILGRRQIIKRHTRQRSSPNNGGLKILEVRPVSQGKGGPMDVHSRFAPGVPTFCTKVHIDLPRVKDQRTRPVENHMNACSKGMIHLKGHAHGTHASIGG